MCCRVLSSIPGLYPLDSCSLYPTPRHTTVEDNQKYLQTLLWVPWGPQGHNCSWLRIRFRPAGALRKQIYCKRGQVTVCHDALNLPCPNSPVFLNCCSWAGSQRSSVRSVKVLLALDALVTLIRTSLVSTRS